MSMFKTNKKNRTQGSLCGPLSRITNVGIALNTFFLIVYKALS